MAYPFLVQHRRKWIVRIMVPSDVRAVLKKTCFRYSTGESDPHRAQIKAAPIIALLQKRISDARATQMSPLKVEAAALGVRIRAAHGDIKEKLTLEEGLELALRHTGQTLTDYARQIARRGPVITDAASPDIIDHMDTTISATTTPFLAYLDQWKPHAGLKPRPLDQAASSLRSFDAAVGQPLETLESKHVQAWIDGMINPGSPSGIRAVTVARKVGEVRNYWRYLQSVQIVPEGRDPFAARRIKDPPSRKETRDEKRQKWQPSEVVALWEHASGDPPLAHAIRVAAYSGARIEGVAQLKVTDIRIDPETSIRFMRMADKSTAGDRDVPIHPAIAGLIDRLVAQADLDGYLIPSTARNKYAERSQPIGKRFGRMKTAMGYDHRYVFHSIRKTVASLFQNALVVEGVASDIVGHVKPGMTYGLYGGTTHMSIRAAELVRAIVYPIGVNGDASANSTT